MPKPGAEQRWTLILASATASLITLDINVVNIALEEIARGLDAGLDELQWVISAYSLSLGALLMTAGSLSDRLGRRRVFVIGVVIFTVASACCGLAQDVMMLAWSRGLQGVGGAFMFAPAIAMIANAYEGRARQTAIGIFFTAGATAGAVAPFLGGLLIELAGWRWIFLINVPLGALTVVAALTKQRESVADDRAGGLDLGGAVLAVAMLFAAAYALIRQPIVGWSDPRVIGALVAAGALLVIFVLAERANQEAMLDLAMFRIPSFTGAALLTLAARITTIGIIAFLTLWLQGMLGHSSLQAGLYLLLISVMWLAVGPLAGRLRERMAVSVLVATGFTLAALGFATMARVGPHSEWTVMAPGMLLIGVGGALTYPPLTSVAVNVVPPARAGMASGVTNSFFPLGTVVAAVAFGAVFSNGIARRMDDAGLLRAGVPAGGGQRLRDAVAAGRFGPVDALPAPVGGRVGELARSAFSGALADVCLTAAAVAGVAAILSLVLLRERHLSGAPRPAGARTGSGGVRALWPGRSR